MIPHTMTKLFVLSKEVKPCHRPLAVLHPQHSVLARCMLTALWRRVGVADGLQTNTSKQQWAELTHAAIEGEKTARLPFLFWMYVQENSGTSFGFVWVNLISVPPVGSRYPVSEQWPGEAETQHPMAVSGWRIHTNKQRKAGCAQVTAQPAVKEHLTPDIVKAITCREKARILITGHFRRGDRGLMRLTAQMGTAPAFIYSITGKKKFLENCTNLFSTILVHHLKMTSWVDLIITGRTTKDHKITACLL